MAEDKKPAEPPFVLPEGRVIYHSLFVRSAFKDPETGAEGAPKYSIELAFDPAQVQGEGTVEDIILDFLDRTAGGTAGQDYLDGKIPGPFISGDMLAAEREAKKKDGSAYKGKLIIRPTTQFNAEGNAEPGGIQVFGPDMSKISLGLGNQGEVYNGCFGIAGVKLLGYKDRKTKQLCLTTYLTAFQKTRDGERLGGASDYSTLFKTVTESAAPARRTRAG